MSDIEAPDLSENADVVVAALKESGDALTSEQLTQLQESESQGKQRQTVLNAIASALEAKPSPDATDNDVTGKDAASTDNDLDPEEGASDDDPDENVTTDEDEDESAEEAEDVTADEGDLPDWKAPDYTGTLTAIQAEWRNKHIVNKNNSPEHINNK